MIALALALVLQDPARELVEQLRADEPAVRDSAFRKLAELGKAAESELLKAAESPDAEVSGRARKLLRRIRVSDSLTPRLREAVPGIVARLQGEDEHEWTAVFLEVQNSTSLRREDFEALAAPALRAAREPAEIGPVIQVIGTRRLRSAAPDLAGFLRHPRLAGQAFPAYRALLGRAAIPEFRRLLSDDLDLSRMLALDHLAELDAKEALPEIRRLLASGPSVVRERAACALAGIAGRGALAELRAMAGDSEAEARVAGLRGLEALGLREAAPQILDAFKSPDPRTRSAAADAVATLRLKEGIPLLAAMLKDADEDLRYGAVEALGRIGSRDAAKALLPSLSDKDEDVREAAVRAVAGLRFRENAAEVAKLLESPRAEVRRGALEILAALGSRPTFDAVALRMKDDVPELRGVAIMALGAIDPGRASSLLVPLLAKGEHADEIEQWLFDVVPPEAAAALAELAETGKEEAVRELALSILSDLYGPPPDVLRRRLEDADPSVRLNALAGVRTGDLGALVAPRLRDSEPDVRLAAVEALARIRSREILGALSDADPEVLCGAIRGVKALGLREAAGDLLRHLRGREGIVRQEAAEALGALGAEDAAPALAELARSPFPYLRASAARGLGGLKGGEARAALEGLRKDPHPYVRRAATEPADAEGSRLADVEDSVAVLAPLLGEPEGPLPQEAARRLIRLGTREAVVAAARAVEFRELGIPVELTEDAAAGVAGLLADEDDDVRARAAGALAAAGVKGAAPRLIELLDGRSAEAAVDALGDLGVPEAIPRISPLLAHPRWAVRRAAAEALGKLRATASEPALVGLLDDPDGEVRHAASLALGALGSETAQAKLVERLAEEDAAAAAALCLLGRREGIPVLLDAAEDLVRLRGAVFEIVDDAVIPPCMLFALNALRSPELRRRLESTPLRGGIAGEFGDVVRQIAKEAGLALLGEPSDQNWGLWGMRRPRGADLWSILRSASFTQPALPGRMEVILEEGKLRLLPLDEAVRLWRAWAAK